MNPVAIVTNRIAGVVAILVCGAALAAPVSVTTAPPAPAATAAAPSVPASTKLDINSASATELTTLPGIGAVRSAAIVSGRPYARKDDLVKRKILPISAYTKIKDQIIAAQK